MHLTHACSFSSNKNGSKINTKIKSINKEWESRYYLSNGTYRQADQGGLMERGRQAGKDDPDGLEGRRPRMTTTPKDWKDDPEGRPHLLFTIIFDLNICKQFGKHVVKKKTLMHFGDESSPHSTGRPFSSLFPDIRLFFFSGNFVCFFPDPLFYSSFSTNSKKIL